MNETQNSQGVPAALGWCLWLAAVGAALVALVIYSLTLAGYLFPEAATGLATKWMGMDALKEPLHPLWGQIVRLVGAERRRHLWA